MAIIKNEKGNLILDRPGALFSQKMIETASIATTSMHKIVGQLSGGNQQKVVIARWLESPSGHFHLRRTHQGVDIGAKRRIYDLMVGLANAGKAILMVSSDMTELISMSDRIVIMRDNTVVDIVDATSVTEQSLVEAFLGIEPREVKEHDGAIG